MNIFISLVVALCSCMYANAQWTKLSPITANDLYSIHFPSAGIGYIAGANGTLLKSTDRGASWLILNSGTSLSLRSICFSDDLTGYAVGENALILRTTDGGAEWTQLMQEEGSQLNSVCFINGSTGFCAGKEITTGLILKTTNGGMSWEKAVINNTSGRTLNIKSIHFPDPDTGYAVSARVVLRSVDAGASWNVVATGPANSDTLSSLLESCFFTDAHTGYVGGWYNPLIAKTENGGTQWKLPAIQPASVYFPGLYAIHFCGRNVGYGAGDRGTLVRTVDGGASWTMQQPFDDLPLYSVYCTDTLTALAAGKSGRIVRMIGDAAGLGETAGRISHAEISPHPLLHSAAIIIPAELLPRYSAQDAVLQIRDLSGRDISAAAAIYYDDDRIRIARGTLAAGCYLYSLTSQKHEIISGTFMISN